MKPVLFLDVDGVLNSHKYHGGPPGWGIHIYHLESLKTILEKSDANIVVSSAWRYCGIDEDSDLQKALRMCGDVGEFVISRIIGQTKNWISDVDTSYIITREYEISDYIYEHNVENYVIIDDIEMVRCRDKQVLTQLSTGLLPEHIDIALNILGI